jgi:hypothetical protein
MQADKHGQKAKLNSSYPCHPRFNLLPSFCIHHSAFIMKLPTPFITLLTALGVLLLPPPQEPPPPPPPDDPDQGHPIPPLTAKQVEVFAYCGCTDREIADLFMISELHLLDRFGLNLMTIRARRKYDLRKAQFDLAKTGDGGHAQMLTWLGRNELGQSLNPQQPLEGEPVLEERVG